MTEDVFVESLSFAKIVRRKYMYEHDSSSLEAFRCYFDEVFGKIGKTSSGKSIDQSGSEEGFTEISRTSFLKYLNEIPTFIAEKIVTSISGNTSAKKISKESLFDFLKVLKYEESVAEICALVFKILDFQAVGEINIKNVKLLVSLIASTGKKLCVYQKEERNSHLPCDLPISLFKEKNSLKFNEVTELLQKDESNYLLFSYIFEYLYVSIPILTRPLTLFDLRSRSKLDQMTEGFSLREKAIEEVTQSFNERQYICPKRKESTTDLIRQTLSTLVLTCRQSEVKARFGSQKEFSEFYDLINTGASSGYSLLNSNSENQDKNEKQDKEKCYEQFEAQPQGNFCFINGAEGDSLQVDKVAVAVDGVQVQHPELIEKQLQKVSKRVKVEGFLSTIQNQNQSFYPVSLKTSSISKIETPTLLQGKGPKLSSEKEFTNAYYRLVDNLLIAYDSRTSKLYDYKEIHELEACFVKSNNSEEINKTKYSSFTINFKNGSSQTYYSSDHREITNWIQSIRESVSYRNFFDCYLMLEELASGSFGKVFISKELLTDQVVVVKVIDKRSSHNLQQIKTEMDLLKFVEHENIVKLIDTYENSSFIFIVMELLKYGNLAKYFKSSKAILAEKDIKPICFQIAKAIEYLHDRNVVHRDLKLENILISEKKDKSIKVKLIDLGLSKILGEKGTATELCGTLAYTAPEIYKKQAYNSSVDIWSFGICVYYLLFKRFPFISNTFNRKDWGMRICNDSLEFPKVNLVSDDACDLISKCLEKNPSKRIKIHEILEHSWFKK